MNRIIDAISNFFRPLSTAQKALFGLLSLGVIILITLLFSWALQPSYSVLFRNLTAESAQTIVTELKATNVDYQLDNNGHTIRVPQEKVYDLRLKFAANGAANGDNYKGYSLFDQNALGMTDFMQHLNKKRALEGELARTINSLVPIKSSRVHIVLPERAPFQENTVKASASVLIKLKPNKSLSKQQTEGISALIAGSVEKLEANNVVILNQNGNKITNNTTASGLVAASTEQLKIRRSAEQYLTHKGQSLLNRVVGPGNSILRVSTEHNFKKINTRSHIIDPGSRTIISEETRESQNTNQSEETARRQAEGGSTAMQQQQSTVEVTNYVVSETNKQIENILGGITGINASVLLNYKTVITETENGETKTTYEPYSDQEIEKVKNVIRAALGINPQQGDLLTVTQIKFQDPYSLNPAPNTFFGNDFTVYEMIRLMLILIVAGAIGYLMYRTSQKMSAGGFDMNRLMSGTVTSNEGKYLKQEETEEKEEDIYSEKLSKEAREQLENNASQTQDIDQFVDQNTEQAANLVRNLMRKEQ